MGLYSFRLKGSSSRISRRRKGRKRRRSYRGGNWLKGKGILSGIAKLIPFAGNAISHVIEKQGYGRRRRRRGHRRYRRRGGSFKDIVAKLPKNSFKPVIAKNIMSIKGRDPNTWGPPRKGRGLGNTIKKIGKYMHDHKVLSNGIKIANSILNPWSTVANIASKSLDKVGLGRRRRRRHTSRRRRRL